MKYIITLIFQIAFVVMLFAQSNPNHVWVNGYYRSNGTYVRGYYRTAPNHTNVDNFSTIGNINPYTLERGWITPDGQTNPWKESDEGAIERKEVKIEPYFGSSKYNSRLNTTNLNSTSSSRMTSSNPSTSLTSESTNYWYSKGDQVNVRFEPTINSKIAFRINRGDLITIKQISESQDYISGYGYDYWYEINYNNLSGWVFGKLIGERNYESTELDNWNGDLQFIKANFVNVRTEPNTKIGKILFQLSKNQEIEILAKTTQTYKVGQYGTDYWYYIKSEKGTGWVFGGLIEM